MQSFEKDRCLSLHIPRSCIEQALLSVSDSLKTWCNTHHIHCLTVVMTVMVSHTHHIHCLTLVMTVMVSHTHHIHWHCLTAVMTVMVSHTHHIHCLTAVMKVMVSHEGGPSSLAPPCYN